MISSRVKLGLRARDEKLFLIPEEYDTPRELRATDEYTYENRWHALKDGFLKAAVDPLLNALACAMGTARHNRAQAIETVRGERIGKAIEKGPEQLDGATRLALLSDPVALSRLHTRVWEEDRDDWLAAGARPRRTTHAASVPLAQVVLGDAGLLPAAQSDPCPGGTPPGHGLFLACFPRAALLLPCAGNPESLVSFAS